MQRHVPAVAPSPDADAICINVGQRLQIGRAVALIGQFLRPKTKMDGLFEQMAATRRAAIIQRENDVALPRHQLDATEMSMPSQAFSTTCTCGPP